MSAQTSRLVFVFLALSVLPAAAAPAVPKAVEPGRSGALIAQVVARIMEQDQYEHKPLDAATSREMLELYVKNYDPDRMFFESPDIAEFKARFGEDVAQRAEEGDIEPGYFIFNRFLSRLRDRLRFVRRTLRTEPRTAASGVKPSVSAPGALFDFTKNERVVLDREKLPWPANERRARELWRQRLKDDVLEEMLDKTKPADQVKDVAARYERLLDYYDEFDSTDVLQAYLTALTRAYDPHSDYMAAFEERNFNISMRLSLVGVGAALSPDSGYARIASVVPGGPADKSKKVHPNDRIVGVAQGETGPFVDTVGMKLDDVVEMIRGKKGTVVRLRLVPAGAANPSARVVVSLTREEIKLKDQEARAQVISWPLEGGTTERLGVVSLPSFYGDFREGKRTSAARDVGRLVAYLKAQGVAGLVLDLRDDGGGSLAEAVVIAGLFDGPGPVVQVRDSRGVVDVLRAPEAGAEYSGPMVVLTSRGSASASEIVTAALQDYRRAVVVGGKSTFGKGTVQTVVDLADFLPASLHPDNPGALKVTVQKFYRVSGGSTQNRGVIPGVRLPSLEDALNMTESSLPNALPYDQIAPADYAPKNDVEPAEIAALERASRARVAVSTDFAYVREDAARYVERERDKSVSLDYAVRLAENQADSARELARNKERASRPAPAFSITDVTLEDVDAGINPLLSTSTGREFAVSISSGAEGAGAPPETDFILAEAAHVLADLIGKR